MRTSPGLGNQDAWREDRFSENSNQRNVGVAGFQRLKCSVGTIWPTLALLVWRTAPPRNCVSARTSTAPSVHEPVCRIFSFRIGETPLMKAVASTFAIRYAAHTKANSCHAKEAIFSLVR